MWIKIHLNDWCTYFWPEEKWCETNEVCIIKNINVERSYWQRGSIKIESRTINLGVFNTRFDWNKGKTLIRKIGQ